MKVISSNFEHKGNIDKKFTCQGEDINPSLNIEDIPFSAKSLALVVDDPDAPGGVWIHWIVYNIPIVNEIKENSVPGKELLNSFGKKGYGGPCPPSGTHRYYFKVYALDKKLDLKDDATLDDLKKEMKEHILAKEQIIGLYKKF
jgi:hypothetical protein